MVPVQLTSEAILEAIRRTLPESQGATLIRGAPIGSSVPFAVETREGSQISLVDDEDGKVAEALSLALGCEAWSLYGDSGSDSMELFQFARGQRVDAFDDPYDLSDLPFDIHELRHWAAFGISGLLPAGERIPL
jgi:hypothetical protein